MSELIELTKNDFDDWELEEDDTTLELTVPQTRFTQCTDKYPLFVAGFGAGKSLTMIVNIMNDLSYPNARVAAYAPTYDLLNLITINYLEEHLTLADIPYKLNKSKYIMSVEDYGDIILRSLDNPARIVGYQVFRSHIDEFDTLEFKKAEQAWNKTIARNRQSIFQYDCNNKKIPIGRLPNGRIKFKTELNRVSVYTTPEGFRFCYHRWEKNKAPGYVIIRAPTRSNPHLPDDYIQTLKDTYPPELIDAYLEGLFVNLTSGAVYPNFDRKLNHSDETVNGNETLYVGHDFNVMRGAAVVHVLRDGYPVAVDEIKNAYDTDAQITFLQEHYPRNVIRCYPDSSGKNRTSSNTTETDIIKLENAGFDVFYESTNPPIKDRVFSLSAMICNAHGVRRYKVNTEKCPELTESLEQQVWDDNGMPDKKAGHDHILDGAGYYIYYDFPIDRPKSENNIVRGTH